MTLLASCTFQVAAPPNEAFMLLLVPQHCLLPRSVRVLSAPARIAEGAQIWIEQRILKILPLVLGFKLAVFEQGRSLEWRMVHGPFSEFSLAITVTEAAGGTASQVRATLRASWPWCYGGKIAERYVIQGAIAGFLQQRANADEVKLCNL